MIARTRALYRDQGLRGVWFGALARVGVYRRLVLVELSLRPPPPVVEIPLELDYGFLASPRDDDDRTRLERGDRCFAAWQDGRIVSSRWIANGRAHVAYLDRWIDVADDDVYLSETWTAQPLRGRGVSGAAGTRLAAVLAAEGKRRIVAAVLPENTGGRRAYEKAGYLPVGRIGFVKLGPWRRDFSSRDGRPARS